MKVLHSARAMDKRSMDGNGYVTVVGNPISKEGVYDYLGSEIPGYTGNPTDIVKVYRPASELSKPETINSFKLMPFIDDHTWLGDEGVDPGELPLTGMTGEQVYWEAPYLKSNIRWFSNDMKAALESGKKELSPAYKFDVDHSPGVFEGQAYLYVQRNLRGNHLALVDTGRTGHDIAVMDAAPEKKMTLEEILAAIAKMDDVQKAALIAGLKASGAQTEVVDQNPEEPVVATDADVETDPAAVDPQKPVIAVDEDPTQGQDEDPAKGMDSASILRRLAAVEKENKILKANAMDSGTIMKAIGERNVLGNRVSQHVGAFAMDSMTTLDVAKYGIKQLGLKDVAPGTEVSTLTGYLTALESVPQKTVAFGMDSAPKKSAVNDVIDSL